MRTALLFACVLAGVMALNAFINAAEPKAPAAAPKADEPDFAEQLPRFAPLEPDEAIKSFQVAKGFRIELVAAEPLVTDPVAMAFDEDGRLFVVEMRDYSEHPNDNLGRVRLLEDTDGDGRMDKSTLFAEGLSWPTAIACSQGGVFVGAAPHIYYLKDINGDGKADEKKVIFTGFSRGNVQGMLNTFLYGLDHRFHCSASSGGGTIRRPDDPNFKLIELRGRDFAFDPITLAMEPISGGAQHGASFDDYGRRFVCSNSDHLQMIMYEDRYAARAPNVPAPPARMSIAADGPQAEVFRISPVEPWRVLRTELRVAGKVPGPIEGGGRAAGYFTSATGLTIYRGDAMPDQRGNAFVADVGSNIIHRKKLTPKGIGFVGTRIDEKAEFVASTDTWFRPVQMANGPDGCLWVADMYRETIEHPASIPPAIKKHVDLNSGRDRGRIYRITREGWKYSPPPKLSKATTAELVKLFEHENAWQRETASRLIHERQDKSAVEPMRKMLRAYDEPLGRIHAMYALRGLGKLTKEDVHQGLGSPEEAVYEHATKLAEPFMAGDISVAAFANGTSNNLSLRVRFQSALSLGFSDADARVAWLAEILSHSGHDRHVRWAALNSMKGDRLALLSAILEQPRAGIESIEPFISELDARDIPAVLKRIPKETNEAVVGTLLAVADRVRRNGDDPEVLILEHAPQFREVYPLLTGIGEHSIRTAKLDAQAARLAVLMITLDSPPKAMPRLVRLLKAAEAPEVQYAAAVGLAGYPQPAVTPFLIEGVGAAGPAAQPMLIDSLLSRKERIAALLNALEANKFPPAALSPTQRMRLSSVNDDLLRARAAKLFAPAVDRKGLVDRYTRDLATLTASAPRGKALFATHCAACHKLENVGHELGPNLAAFAQKRTEAILTNLLDPNREVNPQYLNYVVELKDGEIVSGVITSESASSVTVASGKGVERTVARSEIAALRATGKSIMPEGLEAALDAQAVADVIAYLMSLKDAK